MTMDDSETFPPISSDAPPRAPKRKTGIVYARVSSAEQVQGTSLEMQQRECHEYAKRNDIDVLDTFVEEGESAKTADRTELKKSFAFCSDKKRRVDYFIVHKVDRFARSQEDHVSMRAFLKKCGTELRSVTEPITEDPIGRAMEGMLAVFAEFDNNVRSSRSKSGMVEKVKRGEWVWREPLGYIRIVKSGNLVPDEAMAPYIRQLFEEYAKGGHGFRSLADYMARQGMRTKQGKKPSMQLMEKIIRNSLYCGIIRAFGMEVRGAFAPLISEELYWKCQGKRGKFFAATTRKATNTEFPLRRFVSCAKCGKTLTGSFSRGRARVRYPYYHHHRQDCEAAKSIARETLESRFREYLGKVSPAVRSEALFKAVVRDVWQSNYKRLDSENARIRKEIEVLEAERQRVFDMHRNGKYSDDEFLEQKVLVNKRIDGKRILLADKHIEEFDMDAALSYCFDFIRESAKTWADLKELPSYQLRFQNQIFPEKVSFDGEKFGTTKLWPSLVLEPSMK
jgi:DNA invertase Pin-like site-specific DNA recombinase